MLVFSSVNFQTVFAEEGAGEEEVIDLSSEEKGELYVYPNLDTIDENEDVYEIELSEDPEPEEVFEELDESEEVDPETDIYNDETDSMLRAIPFSAMAPVAAFTPGVLSFFGSGTDNINVYASDTGTRTLTYISNGASYNADAAVLADSNGRYKIKIAGVTGWIEKDSGIMKYNEPQAVSSISHYVVNDSNDLIHNITNGVNGTSYSKILNGPAPTYLSKGRTYYSYDGNYFYVNKVVMLNDYANGNTNNALNKNNPFFNYFQYLPYRTKSNISGAAMDAYIAKEGYTALIADTSGNGTKAHESNMVGAGTLSETNGNSYGTNSAMTFVLGIHESNWGRSRIAAQKNNLFGHEAYDTSPGSATGYKNVNESIYVHNVRFLNWHYLDIEEANYYGGFFGNKQSGINVKYASDAYWGEKAAQHYHYLDRYNGNADYNKVRLGVKLSTPDVNIRHMPTTTSAIIANPNKPSITAALEPANHSFVILGEYTGETISGSNIWYRISLDSMTTVPARTLMPWYTDQRNRNAQYRIGESFGYVHSSLVSTLSYGGTPPVTPPVTPPGTNYKLGDVNNDGLIDIFDIGDIRRHILGIRLLNMDGKKAADVNGDGVIDIFDIGDIRRHILGIRPIR